jgi:signal transduction histidine kinase
MFKIIVIIGISGFILLIYWNRLRTIKRQNILLEKKVTKRTSEIMQMNGLLQTQSQELNSKNLLLQERHQQIEDQAEELTQQKNNLIQMNKELKEANATKVKFFSIIAHDLKNPFNSILGLSELMLKNYKSWKEDKVLQMLVLMNNSSQNLFNLLENLLQWARSQRNIIEFEPEIFELKIVMNECRNLFRNSLKEKNITLTVSSACQKISVYADRQMLNTTMRNLISNAIKFSHNGGQIKITASSSNGMVHISVTDDGMGMSAGDMEQIFRIDSNHCTHGTNREKGTGLGLILVKEFISRHEGTIRVESEVGKGSTFTISLPVR